MKTTYISIVIIILSALIAWYSFDVLSNLKLVLIDEKGGFYIDKYSTSERFLALWPVSLLIASIVALVTSFFFLLAFEASKNADVISLKKSLEREIKEQKTLKNASLKAIENATNTANDAVENANIQVKKELNQQFADIETRAYLLMNEQQVLDDMADDLNLQKLELDSALIESNKLVEQYKRDAKLAKQKAKNHGNALNRKNNILNRLKNDTEYLQKFIARN